RSFHSLFPPPTTTFTSTLSLHDALPIFGANYFNQTFSDFNNSFDTKAMGLFLSPAATINGKPIHGAPNIVIGNFEQIGLTPPEGDRKSTRLNSSHVAISYAVFCLKNKSS